MHNPAPIEQIIYVSKACSRPSQEQLLALLKQARQNNARQGISGLLLYNGAGTFLQVIEGTQASLQLLMKRINGDPRHTRINVLSIQALSKADFPDWQMGFRDLSETNHIPVEGYSQFLNADDHSQYIGQNPSFAYELIKHFKTMTSQGEDL